MHKFNTLPCINNAANSRTLQPFLQSSSSLLLLVSKHKTTKHITCLANFATIPASVLAAIIKLTPLCGHSRSTLVATLAVISCSHSCFFAANPTANFAAYLAAKLVALLLLLQPTLQPILLPNILHYLLLHFDSTLMHIFNTNLTHLDLSFNNFMYSNIRSRFANLTKLAYLNLSKAMFSGSITAQFSNLTSLKCLDISCFYVGLHNLRQLVLRGVDLSEASGSTQWANPLSFLSNLWLLQLSNCRISGKVLAKQLLNLANFAMLKIDFNSFTSTTPNDVIGSSPASFGNTTTLTHFIASDCFLQGQLPASLMDLSNLEALLLDYNNITSHISPKISNLKSLKLLYMRQNSLEGTIPSSVCNISSFQDVALAKNFLTGNLPDNVLMLLDLSYNNLEGTVPTSLGNCASLIFLNLGGNKLSGEVPNELENAMNLSYLDLTDNHFEGSFPSFILDLQGLSILKLGYNKFQGKIPLFIRDLQKLQILMLESNFFQFNSSRDKQVGKAAISRFVEQQAFRTHPQKTKWFKDAEYSNLRWKSSWLCHLIHVH
ncbi:hypothetical protein Patl1_11681 [Pistacia atlantica]|uniref:Uncharacterized protein n=1 Tax=Pistacia atlantica TaxID=434234 RepID=A0ACC1A7F5_9ROSI|nr:hypothetical protein Patl1_11681 [Pistacia atlantica]